MSKKRYRPINKYDEAMENHEVTQSKKNRNFLQENPYIADDPKSKYDDELENTYTLRNKPVQDLQDLYENADQGFIQSVQNRSNEEDLANVLTSPYIADDTPMYIARSDADNYQDMLKTQGDGRNMWNHLWNTADRIDQENHKFTALRAEKEIERLLQEKKNIEDYIRSVQSTGRGITSQGKEELLGKAADIDKLDREISKAKRELYEQNVEIADLQEKMDGRYVDNIFKARGNHLLQEEESSIGDYWMSGEMAEDIGGSMSDAKMLLSAIALSYGGGKAAKWAKRAKMFGSYGKAIGPLIHLAAFAGGGKVAWEMRQHESRAESFGAYEQKLNNLKSKHRLTTGEEPKGKALKKLEDEAYKGAEALYMQNMNLIGGDIFQVGMMFVPWGKLASPFLRGGSAIAGKIPGATKLGSKLKGMNLKGKLPKLNPRNAKRLRRFGQAGPIMGINGLWEGFEEGYQYTTADKFKQGEYDEYGPGFFENLAPSWESAEQAAPAVWNTLVDNPVRGLFGFTEHRHNDRTDSKEFRNAVRAGGLLGIFMGGGISLMQNSLDFAENQAVKSKYSEEFNFINDSLDKYFDSQQRSDRADGLYQVFEKDGGKRLMRALEMHEDYVNQEGLTEHEDQIEYAKAKAEVSDMKSYYDLLQGDRYKNLSKEDKVDAMRAYSHMRHVQATNLTEATIASKESKRIAEEAKKSFKNDDLFDLWQLSMNIKALEAISNSHKKVNPSKETYGSVALSKYVKEGFTDISGTMIKEAQTALDKRMKELGITSIPEVSQNQKYIDALIRKNGGEIGAALSSDLIMDMLDSNKASQLKKNPFYLDIKEWKKQKKAYIKRKTKEIEEYKNSTKADDQSIKEGDTVWARYGNLKGKYVIKNGLKGIENKDGFHPLDLEDFKSMERRISDAKKKRDIKNINNQQRTDTKDKKNPDNIETKSVKNASESIKKTKKNLKDKSKVEEQIDKVKKGDVETLDFQLQAEEDFSYKHHPNIQAGKEDNAVDKFINSRSREDLKNLIVEIIDINTDGIPSSIKSLIAKKEPIDENVDLRSAADRLQFGRNLKVKLKLTDPKTNKSIETFLYNIVSTSELAESDNIVTMYKNILNAKMLNTGSLYGSVSYVDFGSFNNVQGQKARVSKLFGKNKIHLAYNDGKGITDGINPYFTSVPEGQGKGRLYAIFSDPVDKTIIPVKLNNRNLVQEEAEELFEIAEMFLNSTTSNPFTFNSLYKDTGLTVAQYMKLLTFINSSEELAEDQFELENASITAFGFKPSTSTRSAHFQFGKMALTKSALEGDKSKIRQEFINHVLKAKKRQAHAAGLNQNIFDIPLIAASNVTSFSFLGKEYIKGKNDDYNLNFIEADRVLTTDVEVLPTGRIQKERRLVMDMFEFSSKPLVLKEEKKVESLPEDLKGIDTTPINDEEFNEDMFDWTMEVALEPSPKEVLNEKEARVYLDKVLGKSVPVRVKDKLVTLGSNGMQVYAAFTDGILQLSRMAPMGAEYHEAYHVVETAYLNTGEIAALNRETVKKHGEPTKATIKTIKNKYSKWKLTDKEARQIALSEIRAEDYRMYETAIQDDRITFKNLGTKLKRWFNELIDYLVPMFSTTRAAKIYSRISRGYYKQDKQTNKIFDLSMKDFSKSVEETALEEAGFTIKDRNDIATALIQALVTNKGLNNIQDLKDIKITNNILLGYLGFVQKKRAEAGNKNVSNNLDIIKDNISHFYNAETNTGLIPDILSQYKIQIQTEEEHKGNKDVSQAMSSHFEYSGKDNASTNTKILLSFLAKRNKRGEVIVNDRTGLNEIERFSTVWNTIEKALADTTSYAEYDENGEVVIRDAFDLMMVKLDELSKLIPTLTGLSSRVKSLAENDQIRFFNAFSKASMNFVTGIVDKWAYQVKEEGEESMTNIDQSTTRFIDPAVQGRKFVIRKEWLENLKRSKFFELAEKEESLNVNEKVLDTILESWERMKTSYRAELKRMTRDMDTKVSTKYKEGLIEDLKPAGIHLSEMALDALLKMEVTESDALKTLFLGRGRNFGLQDVYVRTAKSKKTGRNPYDFSSIKVRSENINAPMDLNFSENNPFSWANSAINMLAEAEALVNNSMGQSNILGPEGKSYWLYALNSFLTKFSSKLASSSFEGKQMLTDRWSKDSSWLQEILGGNALKIRTFNNLKLSNSKDEGTGNTDLTPSQEHSFRINSTLDGIARAKGLLSPPSMADKSVWNLIEGMTIFDIFENADSGFQLQPDGTMRIGDNIARKFAIYAASEISRVQNATEDLFGKNKLSDEELIKAYHYNGNNKNGTRNREAANALKFILFPSLTTNLLQDFGIMDEEGVFLENWDSDLVIPKLVEFVKPILVNRINDEINFAVENGVITATQNNDVVIYKNNTISSNILKLHKDKYTTKGGKFKEHYGIGLAIGNYTINNMISFIETTKLFSQDPAFYKNLDDLSKRFPELIAPGQDLSIIKGHETYTIAIVDDQIMPTSQYYNNYLKFLIEKKGISSTEAKKILKPYLNVNVTDGQAYITLPRWKSLMRMLGKWDEKYEPTYLRLLKGEKVTAEDYDMILAQPLKGMHYEVRKGIRGGENSSTLSIPTYLKYSQAVLIPSVVKGTELEKLLDAMNNQNVDEVVFDSGIKVGALSPSNIMQDSQNGELSDNIVLNPFVLKNEYWKLQQDLKPHTASESLEGSQVKKNIIANINLAALYKVPTRIVDGVQQYKEIRGQELVEQIHALDRALSDLEKEAMINEWGISTEVEDILTGQIKYHIKDYTKLHGILYKAFKAKKNTPRKLLESLALNESGTGFAIDISSHPFMRDIENMLGSMITDRLVKLKMPGGSFVQQSNFGLQRMKKFTDLPQQSRLELKKQINERGLGAVYFSKNGTVKAQIFLPSWFKEKFVPGHEKLSNEQIKNYIIDKRLLSAIGYRIPNQAMSSIDSFDIVGFLPKSMGDTVIVYDEFTSKTGADFDIDKLYIMLRSYAEGKKGIYYVNYDGNKSIEENREARGNRTELFKKSLRNRKLELYESILASINTFDQLINPLDSENTKEDAALVRYLKAKSELTISQIAEIEASRNTDDFYSTVSNVLMSKNDLEFFSPQFQMKTKETFLGGKFGVGQEARHLVDHAISQWSLEDTESSYYLKGKDIGLGLLTPETSVTDLSRIYDERGGLISNTISGRLDAYVDIAKDPYIFYLNNNAITANTVALLDRAGVDPRWTNRFMGLKVLTDYVKTQKFINSPGSPGVRIGKKSIYKAEDVLLHRLLNDYSARTGTPVADIKIVDLTKEESRVRMYSRRNNISMEEAMERHTADPIRINDIITEERLEELLDSSAKPTTNNIYDQILLLKLFLNLRKTASMLNKAVTASKADTQGASGGVVGAVISQNSIDEVLNADVIGGFAERFNGTMLGKYQQNGPNMMLSLFGDTFLAGSVNFRGIMKDLSEMVGNDKILQNEDAYRKVYSGFISYLFSKTDFYKNIDTTDILYSKNNVVNRLWKFKNQDNSPIKDNEFIKYLSPEFASTKRGHDYIITAASEKKEGIDKDTLTEAWNALLYHENSDVRLFAEDLYKFSILSSGFGNTLFSFHELAPLQYEMENGIYDQFGQQILDVKTHGNILFDGNELKKFLKTQTSNTELVPEYSAKAPQPTSIPNAKINYVYHITMPSNAARKFITREPKEGFKHFVPFIEVNLAGKQVVLMEHIGYNDKGDAIYQLTERNGTYTKGRKIFENSDTRTKLVENQIHQRYNNKLYTDWLGFLRNSSKGNLLKERFAVTEATRKDGKEFIPLDEAELNYDSSPEFDNSLDTVEEFSVTISEEQDLNLMLAPNYKLLETFPIVIQTSKGPSILGKFNSIGAAIDQGVAPEVAIKEALKYNDELVEYLRMLGPEPLQYDKERGKYIGYSDAINKFKDLIKRGAGTDIFISETEINGRNYFFDTRPLKLELEEVEMRLPKNSVLHPIMDTIMNIIQDQHIEVVYADAKDMKAMSSGIAFYQIENNKVFLPNNLYGTRHDDYSSKYELHAMVLLHETIHQLTAASLHTPDVKKTKEEKLFQNRIKSLLDLYIRETKLEDMPQQLKDGVQKYIKLQADTTFDIGEHYESSAEAVNNVFDEFLAYGLTFAPVMKQLEKISINAEGAVGENGTLFEGTVLDNLVKAVVDLFTSLMDKVVGKNAHQLLEASLKDFVKNNVSLDRTLTDLYEDIGRAAPGSKSFNFYKNVSDRTKAKKKC